MHRLSAWFVCIYQQWEWRWLKCVFVDSAHQIYIYLFTLPTKFMFVYSAHQMYVYLLCPPAGDRESQKCIWQQFLSLQSNFCHFQSTAFVDDYSSVEWVKSGGKCVPMFDCLFHNATAIQFTQERDRERSIAIVWFDCICWPAHC